MAFDFDLITIGAGSGGVAASRRAAAHGARVALIEGSRVGGTCVIRGCVPKKLMMYAAQLGDALREAPHYGWSVGGSQFEMARWAASKAAETQRLESIYRQLLDGSRVELVEGWARIAGSNTVMVGERRLTARQLIIATGAAPTRDAIEGIAACATSDDLLDLTALPSRMAVIGSGYIAVEFASIVARLGVEVSLFYRAALPLRGFDEDLRERLAPALQAAGIELMGAAPSRVTRRGQAFELHMADGRTHAFPFVLNATGRRPNTAGLGLETLGIAVDSRGAVPVDAATLGTSAEGVHAIGDVTNLKNLTPVAIAQGRTLADALFGGRAARPLDLARAASAVFTLPPIATAGFSEVQALAAGHDVTIYEADFRPMRQAFYGGQERSYMKLVVDADTDVVLGAHMLGIDAPEIVQSLAVALTCGATKDDFDATMAVHPTAAEEFMLMREPTRTVRA